MGLCVENQFDELMMFFTACQNSSIPPASS